MQERMEMQGNVRLLGHDREGRIVLDRTHSNLIVLKGRELVAHLFAEVPGAVYSKVSHMGVGEGFAPPMDGDAALGTERVPRNPIQTPQYLEFTEPDGSKRWKVQLQSVFGFDQANGPVPLREAGIFTADTGGILYNRVVFEPVVKASTFQLTLIWDIVF